jgi:plasmid maintenance system antidote protein VapI
VTFGEIIARACRREKVSHGELARRIDQAPSRVPEIIRSDNLTERTLRRCAKALGLDVEVKLVRRRG